MTAKFGQGRKDAFVAALRESGNLTLAAERAKVSRSWVTLHRKGDSTFGRAVEEALAEARTALGRARSGPEAGCKPPRGWGFLDGEELVVRGTGGSGGAEPDDGWQKGRPQIARARLHQWTPRVEARFLRALAATCNVNAACAEAGMSPASAYNHRKRWPGFAERWDEAVDTGYCRIEAGLVARASNPFSDEGIGELAPIGGMTVAQAIHLLHMHKHETRGIGKPPGISWRRPKTLDDVRESIVRKIQMVINAGEVSEAQKARDRGEWRRRRENSG